MPRWYSLFPGEPLELRPKSLLTHRGSRRHMFLVSQRWQLVSRLNYRQDCGRFGHFQGCPERVRRVAAGMYRGMAREERLGSSFHMPMRSHTVLQAEDTGDPGKLLSGHSCLGRLASLWPVLQTPAKLGVCQWHLASLWPILQTPAKLGVCQWHYRKCLPSTHL